ncbi:MAG: hypothetical protein JWR69_1857, partial [Pedosphaera sp.]|nr:hypothetical protein [Pedosphaera sp.]
MARKLYIFNPSGRQRNNAQPNAPMKWLGAYSSNYTYLGDYHARMLGVGSFIPGRRMPAWLHTNAAPDARPLKGGASRLDRDFRGWG